MRHRTRKRHHRANPKRRHRKSYMMVGKKYSHNPRRKRHYSRKRHYRHNPISAMMAGADIKRLFPMVAAVTAGVISVDLFPMLLARFLPSAGTGALNYVAKAGVIYGGGMVAKKIGGRDAQIVFVAGGIAKVVLDFVGNSIISMVAGLASAPAVATSGYGFIAERGGPFGAIIESGSSLGSMADEDSIY